MSLISAGMASQCWRGERTCCPGGVPAPASPEIHDSFASTTYPYEYTHVVNRSVFVYSPLSARYM